MKNTPPPITPLPQHPFIKGPAIPVDPFEKTSMHACLKSLERIRCVAAFILSCSTENESSESPYDSHAKDALAGRTYLISSLHESLNYVGEQMMSLSNEEQANIEKQLRDIDPIAADLYGYELEEELTE